ncbi:MAG: SdrD B-like domain-containing protein [Erythrobacter sp.]
MKHEHKQIQAKLRRSLRAKALGSIALAPVCLALAGYSVSAQIVNDAVATGTPDTGTLTDAMATESVTVAIPILAENDTATSTSGETGDPDALNVFDNDILNGGPASPANTVLTLAPGATVPPELTFDPATGQVGIAPDTPAGVYTFDYQLCETANPDNCRIATVTITVTAPTIEATNDSVTGIVGAVGADDAINAFDNDELGGAPVNIDDITATVTSPATAIVAGAPVPVLDPDTGLVNVPAGTPAGPYEIEYEICEDLNPTNCATALVTIEVEAAPITAAVDAPEPVAAGVGAPNAINAFDNDTLNGVPVDPADITATVTSPASDPGVVLDPDTGNVSIGPDVPAGPYVIEYEICETLNPTNCATSTVTVVVEPALSAVEGTVFTDVNGDGVLDDGDQRRPGFIVEILRNGETVATTVADLNGDYSFTDLISGDGYEIRFINPENNVVYDILSDVELPANTTVLDQDLPIDPSGVVYDSVSRDPVSGVTLAFADAAGNPLPEECFIDPSQASQTTGASGEYRFDIVPGAAAQCPLNETEYQIIISPPAGFSAPSTVIPPLAGPLDPTGQTSPVRVNPLPTAPTGSDAPYFLTFELETGDPDVVFNHIPIDPFLTRGELVVTKTSTRRTASVGDIVPYEIIVRNAENVQRADVDVVDILPSGTQYVEGTSLIDGVAQEPEQTGRTLVWEDQVIPANGFVTYNLAVVIGAGVTAGEKVNTGVAQDGVDGAAISNRGTAVVAITPSAVFDCSELIGKVFEDADRDGYQDEGEPGVPGVRLATVNGQLITTDEFGRYHIACAAVPDARIGSNFVLKIDTRTLPLGWEPTTDNPRSIRLTRGKFGELNFGVAPREERENSTNREENGE